MNTEPKRYIRNFYSFYLFAKPSFVEGMARIFDFSGSLQTYNENISPEMADYYAIRSDWLAVGGDIKESMEKYERESFKQ